MTDYTSNASNIYFMATFMPNQKWNITGSVNFNKSTAKLDEVVFPDLEDRLDGDLHRQDFTFEAMDSYSELDYAVINLGLGLKYLISPRVTLEANIDYAELEDKTGYVYGLESGSSLLIRSGVSMSF